MKNQRNFTNFTMANKFYFKFLNWLRSKFPDPVHDCSLYKEQGCSYVDGLLCDFPECTLNKQYQEEKKSPEVYVFNHADFDAYCIDNGINDRNVEEFKDQAFISIIGTPEILEYYLKEPNTNHWFDRNHPNVLNLEFDDVSNDRVFDYKDNRGQLMSLHAFTMNQKQAKECVDFIENNLGKNFRIHCLAGKSRSQAIGRFLLDCYEEYKDAKENPNNPCVTFNPGILATLKREFYKRNKMFI